MALPDLHRKGLEKEQGLSFPVKDIVRHVGNVKKEGCDGGTQPPEQTCRLLSTLTEMPLTLHLWSALS